MLNNFSADFMHNEAITKELDAFTEEVENYFFTKTYKNIEDFDDANVFNDLETLTEETKSRVREIDASFDCGCFVGSFMERIISSCAGAAYERIFY